MTTTEFSNEFDILFDSIATKSAPGLDLYEKSVYLTKAQLEIVKSHFDPSGNKYKKGFEQSSKRRDDLKELIRNYKSTLQISSDDGIDDNSVFFRIPNNVFLIIQEKAKVVSSDKCVNGKYIKVVPKTHDEYNIQIDNPFRKPDKKNIWRLDYYSQNGSNKNIELISEYPITEYTFRYVMYPSPIILGDLLSLFPGENLTIDDATQEQTSKLSKNIHREILDRAVELAWGDYKQGNLQTKVQMNLRNE